MIAEFKGSDGTATLYEDKVVIQRKGIMAKLTHFSAGTSGGDRTIFLDQIRSIEINKGLVNCDIFFNTGNVGELSGGRRKFMNDGASKLKIEYSVEFVRTEAKKAEEFKSKVEDAITKFKRPATQPGPATQSAPSAADEMKKFKELLDAGAISQEEFEIKKKQLLGL